MYYTRKLSNGCVHTFDSREIWDDRQERLLHLMSQLSVSNPERYRISKEGNRTYFFVDEVPVYKVED